MKIWRRMFFLAVALVLLFSLTVAVTSAQKSTTLNLWTMIDDQAKIDVINKLAKEFEELNPNVKVSVTIMSRADTDVVLPMAIAAGTGPDIADYDIGDSRLGALVKSDLVYDLTDAYKARGWDKRLMPFAVKLVTYDGRICAVPYQQEAQGLWYNAAIFRKLGLNPPNTWQDFIDAAKKSKSAGIIPIDHGTGDLALAPQLLANIVYGLIPKEIVNDASTLEGTSTWKDDPRFLQAVKTQQKWIDDGWLPKDPNSLKYQDVLQIFLRGDAAMGTLGPWSASAAMKSWEDGKVEPVFVPMPAQDTSFPLTNQGAPGSSFFIPKSIQKDKVEAVLDLLDYLWIRSESQKIWLFEAGILPLTVENFKVEDFGDNKVLKSVWEAHNYLGERGGVSGLWLDQYVSPEAGEEFTLGQQRLVGHSWTPEQFIERISETAIKARQKAGIVKE